jgi:hypothetical protein
VCDKVPEDFLRRVSLELSKSLLARRSLGEAGGVRWVMIFRDEGSGKQSICSMLDDVVGDDGGELMVG